MAEIIDKLKINGRVYKLRGSDGGILQIEQGGTGANNRQDALANLHAAETTKEALTYYINRSKGDDTNDGLSIDTPFKTIQHAINIIPDYIKHSVNIYLAAGTYSEEVEIRNKTGYTINIIGGNGLDNCADYKIKGVHIVTCSSPICFQGINFPSYLNDSSTEFKSSVLANHAFSLRFTGCSFTSGNAEYGIRCSQSCVDLIDVNMKYQKRAVAADYSSRVECDNITGSNNTYGFYASNGSIIFVGTPPTSFATTMHTKFNSIIINNGTLV